MSIAMLLSTLLLSATLSGFNLVAGTRPITITPDSLHILPLSEVKTEREKRGEMKTETWSGVSLPELLCRHGIDPKSDLRIISADNYQALLTPEQTAGAILAIFNNGSALPPEKIRLVNPDIRDMFWVQNLILIEVRNKPQALACHKLLLLDRTLGNMAVRPELPPFTEVTGWYFRDLAGQLVSEPKGVWFLWGRDGVCQTLDYDTYLRNAVIIRSNDLLELKSPDMPAGMWLKDLAVIPKDEIVFIHTPRFADLGEVKSLLEWQSLPDTVTELPGHTRKTGLPPFSDPWWSNERGIQW